MLSEMNAVMTIKTDNIDNQKDNIAKETLIQDTSEAVQSLEKNNSETASYFIDPEKLFVDSYDKFSDNLKAQKIISIEIDSTGFKVLYLSTLYHRYRVNRLAEETFVSTNPTAIRNDLKSIPRILKRKSIRHSEIVLCLSGPEIFIKTVVVPELSGRELKEAVYWTVNKDSIIFSETDVWHYKIIGKTILHNKPAIEVLTICAHEEFIRRYLNLLKSVGIQPDRIIVKPIALVSALKLLLRNKYYTKNNFVVVDISKDKMTVCFISYGNLKYYRTLNINCELSKITPKRSLNSREEKPVTTEINHSIDHNEQLRILNELKRSIIFFSQNINQLVNQIFITGICCESYDFDVFLSKHLSVNVIKLIPTFPITKKAEKIRESNFTTALGAACSEFNLYKLIPKDVKLTKKYKFYQSVLLLTFLSAVFLTSIISIELRNSLREHKYKHSNVYNSYVVIQDIDHGYSNLINEVSQLNTTKNNIESSLKLDRDVENILRILSNYTPEDIFLEQLEYLPMTTSNSYDIKNFTQGNLNIKGKVYKNFVFADVTLAGYVTKLKELDFYKSVNLNKKKRDVEAKTLMFDITIELKR